MGLKFFKDEAEYNSAIDKFEKGYPGAGRKVLGFIAMFTNTDSAEFSDTFLAGLCYYFAVLLKQEFDRGKLVFKKTGSHIVWLDEDNIAYDAGGVWSEYCDGDLLPIEILDPIELNGYKHKGFYPDEELIRARIRTFNNIRRYEQDSHAPLPQIRYTCNSITIMKKYLSGEYSLECMQDKLRELYPILCDEMCMFSKDKTSLF